MTDTVLTKAQGIALLTKLSTDDGFRKLYAECPDKGLLNIGVPANVVSALPSTSIAPIKALADKTLFAAALKQLQNDEADICLCQNPPSIRLNFGQ